MSFASDSGYVPISVSQMMDSIMENVNTQFATSYTTETFLGTNFYKYFYAMIQRLQENEVKTSEIFLRMQEYFVITNEKILRPNTTHPGIYDYFQSLGYFVSTKPPEDADRGKAYICVDVDEDDPDYDDVIKPAVCAIVKDCVVAGVISQGTESESITLTNGQSFEFKYNLPDRIPIKLRLTTTLSDNNEFTISTPEIQKQTLFDNIGLKYRLGKNFEPQRYFSVIDAPWAAEVLLEWTDDVTDGVLDMDAVWHDEVFEAAYNEVFTFDLSDITLVES
jgi:hypothetical protein